MKKDTHTHTQTPTHTHTHPKKKKKKKKKRERETTAAVVISRLRIIRRSNGDIGPLYILFLKLGQNYNQASFPTTYLLCKFDEASCKNILQAKNFQARTSHGLFLHSEALGAIIREIQGRFSMMTPFDLEAGVKGQIQHLEKIIRP